MKQAVKICAFVLCGLLVLSGCAGERAMVLEPVTYDSEPISVDSLPDLTLSALRVRGGDISWTLRNDSDHDRTYGLCTGPNLEFRQDGGWYRLALTEEARAGAHTDMLYYLQPQEEEAWTLPLSQYGISNLEPGSYRITFQMDLSEDDPDVWLAIPLDIT